MTKERRMKKSKKIFRIILLIIAVAVTAEFIYSNSVIDVEKISYNNEQIPKNFDGAVIVHISDYHSHGGSYEDRLIEKVKEQNPDYVFITGDIIDAKSTIGIFTLDLSVPVDVLIHSENEEDIKRFNEVMEEFR